VRHLEAQKKAIEKEISVYARKDRWSGRVEALRCMKGIETMTAFSLVVEAGVFSRFGSARAFSSWLGLTPSEHSSGERVSRGGITKAGNTHLRKLLVESSWHYTRATKERKRNSWDKVVSLAIENHAAKGVKRMVERRVHFAEQRMRPVVANVATARELSCWVWALGRMAEGTLD
ncbi:MAG: transposase, partial [Raoultibacter sp.]